MLEDAPMTAQDALAALMIAMSASDEHIRTAELVKMSNAINNLPVFAGYVMHRYLKPYVTRIIRIAGAQYAYHEICKRIRKVILELFYPKVNS